MIAKHIACVGTQVMGHQINPLLFSRPQDGIWRISYCFQVLIASYCGYITVNRRDAGQPLFVTCQRQSGTATNLVVLDWHVGNGKRDDANLWNFYICQSKS